MSIIREHGGIIEAEALAAGGSAFTVFLPAAPPEQAEASATSETASASAVPAEGTRNSVNGRAPSVEVLKGRSILVLDDEESLRQLLHEGLSAQGLRVDCAATVEEALALLERFLRDGQHVARHAQHRPYDILLCDLHLSAGGFFVDGRAAAAQILAAAGRRKPAVVYMTGDLSDPGADAPARGEPFFLQKPFRISEVLALFREVLTLAEPQPK
jgi:CheY-like chemotaxis protein